MRVVTALAVVFLATISGPSRAQPCIWSPNCTDPRDLDAALRRQSEREAEQKQRAIDAQRREENRQVQGPKVILVPGASGTGAGPAPNDYASMMRIPGNFVGRMIMLGGKVIQVIPDGSGLILRVNVTHGSYGSWTDTVWVDYPSPDRPVAEGQLISFRGTFKGLKTYTAVLGQAIQIPHIVACDVQDYSSGIRTLPKGC